MEDFTKLLGPTLLRGGADGGEVPTEEALKGATTVAVYASAHWCGPCRGFTPVLAKVFEDIAASGEPGFRVVFVSSDNEASSFAEYFAEMPDGFFAVPFERAGGFDGGIYKALGVRGIPHLATFDGATGAAHAGTDARALVATHGAAAFPFTPARSAALLAEALAAKDALLAETLGDFAAFGTATKGGDTDGGGVAVSELLASDAVLCLLLHDRREGRPDRASQRLADAARALGEGALAVVAAGWDEPVSAAADGAAAPPLPPPQDYMAAFRTLDAELSKELRANLSAVLGDVEPPQLMLVQRAEQSGGSGVTARLLSGDAWRAVAQHGADGFPWDAAKLAELAAAAKARMDALRAQQRDLAFLGGALQRGVGADADTAVSVADVAANNDVVGLYFSAHWCGPCRAFTPELKKLHAELRAAGKKFEVVFLSSDRDQEAFDGYFGEMPWLALPYAARAAKEDLSKLFEVRGIPTLVLLKGDGTLITRDGREAAGYGAACFPWGEEDMARGKAEAKAKAADAAAAAAAKEDAALAVQKEMVDGGELGAVVERLRGERGVTEVTVWGCPAGCPVHEVEWTRAFTTVGAPGCAVPAGAKRYFEVTVRATGDGIPQFGWATAAFARHDRATGEGVGDDAHSWGVDGVRGAAWSGGGAKWEGAPDWGDGTVVGFAADLSGDGGGALCFSVDGTYVGKGGAGDALFEGAGVAAGLFPALTAQGNPFKITLNLGGAPFKHGPPPGRGDGWQAADGTPIEASKPQQVQVGGNHNNVEFSEDGTALTKYPPKPDELASAVAWYPAATADARLAPFLPAFHGAVGDTGFKMSNALAEFDAATTSVLDIKVGTRTYVETCSAAPSARYDSKFAGFGVERTGASKLDYMQWRDASTTSKEFGFRVTAARIARGDGAFASFPTSSEPRAAWEAACGPPRAAELMVASFAHEAEGKPRADVVKAFISKLQELQAALSKSAVFQSREIIGSSLLFAYDATGRASVTWIDFAHVYEPEQGGKKDGIEAGVAALVALFGRVLARLEGPADAAGGEDEGPPFLGW